VVFQGAATNLTPYVLTQQQQIQNLIQPMQPAIAFPNPASTTTNPNFATVHDLYGGVHSLPLQTFLMMQLALANPGVRLV
jgi:hypothetical protein